MRRSAHLRPIDVAADVPFPTINTTPLIDLMLVLLVMFIISIPIATHKVPLDLPPPIPGQKIRRPFIVSISTRRASCSGTGGRSPMPL